MSIIARALKYLLAQYFIQMSSEATILYDTFMNRNKQSINLIFKIMNKDQLEGKWKQVKGEFKQKYGKLTDDDLKYSEGKFDEMIGKLQEKTGKKREEIEKEINEW